MLEDGFEVAYFTNAVDMTKPTFITFVPRYRLANKGEELKDQILTCRVTEIMSI